MNVKKSKYKNEFFFSKIILESLEWNKKNLELVIFPVMKIYLLAIVKQRFV